jgi:hypothetical protein
MARNDFFNNIEFTKDDLEGFVVPGNKVEDKTKVPGNGIITEDDDLEFEKEFKTNTGSEDDQGNSTGSENKYQVFFEEFASRKGIEIPKDLKFEDADDVLNAIDELIIQSGIKKGIDAKFENANPHVKRFLEVKDYYDDEVQALAIIDSIKELESLSEKDLEDEDVQAALYKDELMTVRKMSEAEANEYVEQAKALAKLEELGAKSKDKLKSFYNQHIEAAKTNSQSKQEKNKKKAEDEFNAYLKEVDKLEEIGGFKLTKEQKELVKKNIVTTVRKENGKSYTDLAYKQHKYPTQFNAIMEFLNTMDVFKENTKTGKIEPDFSKFSTLERKKIERKLDSLITEGQTIGKVGIADGQGNMADVMKSLGY